MFVGRILFFLENPHCSSTLHCNNLFLLQDSILDSVLSFMWLWGSCLSTLWFVSNYIDRDMGYLHASVVFYCVFQRTHLIWQVIFLSRIFLYSWKQKKTKTLKPFWNDRSISPNYRPRKSFQSHEQSKKYLSFMWNIFTEAQFAAVWL